MNCKQEHLLLGEEDCRRLAYDVRIVNGFTDGYSGVPTQCLDWGFITDLLFKTLQNSQGAHLK